MPKMSECAGMHINDVMKWISLARHSYYHKIYPKDIANELDHHSARRYLAQLCVDNGQLKSKLDDISEQDSNIEYSVGLKASASRG